MTNNNPPKKETVTVLETVLFTTITERTIKSKSPLKYFDLLNCLCAEHKLQAQFSPFYMFGRAKDICKAQDLLINSVKYN